MAEIKPFQGITYNQREIQNLSLVIAPPYDVISDEARERLYQNSPYNIIRIIKGKTDPNDTIYENQYTRANQFLQTWIKTGVFQQDEEPGIYLLEDEYNMPGSSKKMTRQGFIALVKLEELGQGKILPHERTLSKPKEDRLRLMQACRANLCPIFGLYSDPCRQTNSLFEEAKQKTRPFIDVLSQDRIVHRVWKISCPEIIKHLTGEMESKYTLIADGHHRYETALTYWRQMEDSLSPDDPVRKEFSYVMMYFANMDNPGLAILPYHRLLKNLPEENLRSWKETLSPFFRIEEFAFDGLTTTELQAREKLFFYLAEKERKSLTAFGLYSGDKHYYLLSLHDQNLTENIAGDQPLICKQLDVNILDHFVVNRIVNSKDCLVKENCLGFSPDHIEAIHAVNTGKYHIALFLNPTKIQQVYQVAAIGEKMPQKSTFFYPKLASGLVLRKI